MRITNQALQLYYKHFNFIAPGQKMMKQSFNKKTDNNADT